MPIYEGESIEQKVARVLLNEEPIEDTAEPIYTDYADGVIPSTDIRTDKFEEALNTIDAAQRDAAAKAMQAYKDRQNPNKEDGALNLEPKQGTLEANTNQEPSGEGQQPS